MADDPKVMQLSLVDGTKHTLRGWRGVEAFNKKVQAAWSWMRSDTDVSDPYSMLGNARNQLDQLNDAIRIGKESQGNPADYVGQIEAIFGNGYGPYHPDSATGQRILDIYEAAGSDAGLFAWGLSKNIVAFNQPSTVGHGRGAMLWAYPTLAGGGAIAGRINAERQALKTDTRSIVAALEAAETDREATFLRFLGEAAQRNADYARKRSERNVRLSALLRKETQAAIDSIRTVERAYTEGMKLKASVKYWKDKATEHSQAEDGMLWNLKLYFGAALVSVSLLFWFVGRYLIELGPDIDTSIYFVTTGGVATIVGLILWVGRLLTRIYLSEQHLRHDAHEREVMTTTYLALTAEEAASDADRQIILNALFRNTPDGIVKEEGGMDPQLATFVTRMLMPR